MNLEEMKNEVYDATTKTPVTDDLKINLLEAIQNTIILSENLDNSESVVFCYSSIIKSKEKLHINELDNKELALLSNALIGALLTRYL